jgi:hypothetical protein
MLSAVTRACAFALRKLSDSVQRSKAWRESQTECEA